jgi:hypothetical protein
VVAREALGGASLKLIQSTQFVQSIQSAKSTQSIQSIRSTQSVQFMRFIARERRRIAVSRTELPLRIARYWTKDFFSVGVKTAFFG